MAMYLSMAKWAAWIGYKWKCTDRVPWELYWWISRASILTSRSFSTVLYLLSINSSEPENKQRVVCKSLIFPCWRYTNPDPYGCLRFMTVWFSTAFVANRSDATKMISHHLLISFGRFSTIAFRSIVLTLGCRTIFSACFRWFSSCFWAAWSLSSTVSGMAIKEQENHWKIMGKQPTIMGFQWDS